MRFNSLLKKEQVVRGLAVISVVGSLAVVNSGCGSLLEAPADTMNDAAQDSLSDLSEVPIESDTTPVDPNQ